MDGVIYVNDENVASLNPYCAVHNLSSQHSAQSDLERVRGRGRPLPTGQIGQTCHPTSARPRPSPWQEITDGELENTNLAHRETLRNKAYMLFFACVCVVNRNVVEAMLHWNHLQPGIISARLL